jgi:hypothetical protein
MALLDRPGQPQRYSLLAPDVMNLIQSGGPRVAPAPVAPVQPDRRGQPGFLTYLLGGSEGMEAERARRQAEAERPQMMARQAEVLAAIQDPQERALFLGMGSPDWQTNVGMRYRPVTTGAGSRTTYGPSQGAFSVEQPTFGETGDETVRRDSMGVRPVYTRTAPSITERVNQGELGVKQQLADQAQQQFGQRLELDRSRFNSDEEYRQALLVLENQKFEAGQNAPRPGTQEIAEQLSAIDTGVDPVLRDMQGLLQSGDVITGYGADARLEADRALAGLGNADARRRVAATERYKNLSGRLRVGMAKSLGTNPSNADILLLERVTAGDINQTREGLLSTLQDGASLAERQRAALMARIPAPASGGQAAPTPDPLEGRTAVNDSGQRMIRRNGQWVRQ